MNRAASEAKGWEQGSKADPIRNEFVIPVLARLIEIERPTRILDIGTGTGYVPRQIDLRLSYQPFWTLVDLNRERLELAKSNRLATAPLECVNINILDWPWEIGRFDAVFATFTLLEIEEIDQLCSLISEHATAGMLLVVTMPDAWIDVLQHAGANPEIVGRYVDGSVEIPKVDKFTGREYPFKAIRIENLIGRILKVGFDLFECEHGRVGDQSAFILAFRRRDSA